MAKKASVGLSIPNTIKKPVKNNFMILPYGDNISGTVFFGVSAF